MAVQWDQSTFNRTLDVYLRRLPAEDIPRAITKKAFFIALRAMSETPKVNPHKIFWELQRPITASREDGSLGTLPIGYVMAARRASKSWVETSEKARGKKRKKAGWEGRAWRALIKKKFETMVGSRQRATAFLRSGWLAAVRKLGPAVRNKSGAPTSDTSGVRIVGVMKGDATPARPGWNPEAMISNTAQAQSDKRLGLLTIGAPALQRAFDAETADMEAYLEREAFKDATDQFNAAQH